MDWGKDLEVNENQLVWFDSNRLEELKKDLTWTPLPSASEVWEEGKKNGDKMKEEFKQKGAEMAMDLLPAGAVVGMTKGVARPIEEFFTSRYARLFNREKVDSVLKDALDPKSRSTIAYMTPDEFLTLAKSRGTSYDKAGLTKEQIKHLGEEKRGPIREAIKSGGLRQIPQLWVEGGAVVGHEGRHRMDVFKEMGYERIPVEIRDSMYRWGENPPPYTELISEEGGKKVRMPKSAVWED